MTGFRCLGGACEDTCCAGWTVPVDEPTHRRLRVLAETEPLLKQLVDEGIELTPGAASFGRLKFAASGYCSMLDDQGLCTVHARLGPDALAEVCSTYPRYYNAVNGELELFGTLSCPEVARLCLLSDDGFALDRLADQEAPRKLRNQFETNEPYYQPYMMLRAAFIELLTSSDYELSDKLFVLLWMSSKLAEFVHTRAQVMPVDDLSLAVKSMLAASAVRELSQSYRGLELDGSLALSIVTSLLGEPAASDAALAWRDYVAMGSRVPAPVRARIDTSLTRYVINHLHTTPYMLSENLLSYA